MRRGLVHAGAWAVATGAGMTLSWAGVSAVLRDPSAAGPAAVVAAQASGAATPASAPPPSAHSGPAAPVVGTATRRARPPAAGPSGRPAAPGPSASGSPAAEVRSYQIRGGQVAVSLGTTAGSLVSATPNAGWSMHVYRGDEWFRVDFEQGSSDSALFVTWNGHPPMVSTYEH